MPSPVAAPSRWTPAKLWALAAAVSVLIAAVLAFMLLRHTPHPDEAAAGQYVSEISPTVEEVNARIAGIDGFVVRGEDGKAPLDQDAGSFSRCHSTLAHVAVPAGLGSANHSLEQGCALYVDALDAVRRWASSPSPSAYDRLRMRVRLDRAGREWTAGLRAAYSAAGQAPPVTGQVAPGVEPDGATSRGDAPPSPETPAGPAPGIG